MTILSRLANRAMKVAVTDLNDTIRSVPLGSYETLGDYITSAGEYIGVNSAMRIVTVYACVRVLAETVASLPLFIYRRLPNGGKERATDHPLYPVLHDQPNPQMTSFTWRELLMSHLTTWGNTYSEKAYDRSNRLTLWPLRPDRVECWYDAQGRRRHRYIDNNGKTVDMKVDTVFHIPGLSFNGLKGFSPITYHREALGLYQAAQNFGTNFFRNNARPAIVLTHPDTLSEPAVNRLKKQIDANKGPANSGKTLVLEEGIQIKEIGIPPEDAQYIETRKFQMQEIARMFRVPPHMIGDLERATFSNIEHQSIDFVVHTIRPWLVRIEQEINSQLLFGEEDVFAEFLVDGLLRGDSEARSNSLNTMRNAGIINANEWRAIENMNPIEGDEGDAYWRPLNIEAVGTDTEQEPPPTQGPPVAAPPAAFEEVVPVPTLTNGR